MDSPVCAETAFRLSIKEGPTACSIVPLLPFHGQSWNASNCPNPWSADGRFPGINVVPYAIPPISAYSVSGGYR